MLYSKIKFIKDLLKDNLNELVNIEANKKLCLELYVKIFFKN